MAEKKGFEVDQLGAMERTSFSQLLYEVEHDVVGLCFDENQNQIFNNSSNSCSSLYSSSSDLKSPKMLCFGDFQNTTNSHGEFGVSCNDSSSVSSITKTINKASLSSSSKSNNNKKRNVLAQEPVQCGKTATVGGGQRNYKKSKTDKPTPGKRREKLGERISALQQLVSPFGKTDTASVLHEAMGYIRFLHDQVQVLWSPYLQRSPSPSSPDGEGEGEGVKKEVVARSNDLRSRGLCLVPAEYTEHVANNNGADFWSPAAMGNNINNNAPPSVGY